MQETTVSFLQTAFQTTRGARTANSKSGAYQWFGVCSRLGASVGTLSSGLVVRLPRASVRARSSRATQIPWRVVTRDVTTLALRQPPPSTERLDLGYSRGLRYHDVRRRFRPYIVLVESDSTARLPSFVRPRDQGHRCGPFPARFHFGKRYQL